MIQLFSKPNCPQCVATKAALKNAAVPFDEMLIDPDMQNLKQACDQIEVDYRDVRSAPVMIANGMVWTGADCLIAVEEEEYK